MKKPKRKKPKFGVGEVVRLRDHGETYRKITGVELWEGSLRKSWIYHFAGDSWSLLESELRYLTKRERRFQ